MQDLIERRAALTALCEDCLRKYDGICPHPASRCVEFRTIKQLPAIEAEQVRRGHWIECDYKHLEHGMIKTEPNAGLCCSNCRTAFQKKKMTYKQYCAACGAKMDGGVDNGCDEN